MDVTEKNHSSGTWIKTAEQLPRTTPGEQAFILMWSPEWATWVQGMFTFYEAYEGSWAVYDAYEDRFYDWHEEPEYWCEIITPPIN